MLFSLGAKDVAGPIVSIGAAALSAFFLWKNYTLTRRNSDRAIYVEGQKFLIEICKQLMADPSLWCIYDDEELQKDTSVNEPTPLFHAKIRAFAHLHLNMFEIILTELPPVRTESSLSIIWFRYFEDTLGKSKAIRDVLEEKDSGRIWSPRILREYAVWKANHPPRSAPVDDEKQERRR
jgi:hypothetical protein